MLRWLTNVSEIFLLFVFDESLLPLFFSQCNRDSIKQNTQSIQIIITGKNSRKPFMFFYKLPSLIKKKHEWFLQEFFFT